MVEQSLGTSDKREARKREAILTAKLEETWDALRGQGSDLQRWQASVEWLAEQEQLDLDDEGAWAGASAAYDALIEGKAKLPEGATEEAFAAYLRGEATLPRPRFQLRDAFKVWDIFVQGRLGLVRLNWPHACGQQDGRGDLRKPGAVLGKPLPNCFLVFVTSPQANFTTRRERWIEAAEVHHLHVNAVRVPEIAPM